MFSLIRNKYRLIFWTLHYLKGWSRTVRNIRLCVSFLHYKCKYILYSAKYINFPKNGTVTILSKGFEHDIIFIECNGMQVD